MTSELQLAATRDFNGVKFNCYVEQEGSNDDFWATRKQIGELLEYAQPVIAIGKIHQRNKERLDMLSRVTQIDLPSGGRQATTVYNFKGLLEICRYSQQPRADAVIDVLWDIADEIRRTGFYAVDGQEPLNVRTRVAEVLQRLALQVSTKFERDVINHEAYKYATGHEMPAKKEAEPKPKAPRYWTAEQIGKTLSWPAEEVMLRAENVGITDKAVNGYWDDDTWNFSKEGRKKFLDIVSQNIVRIEEHYAYYGDGRKHLYWSFEPCVADMN